MRRLLLALLLALPCLADAAIAKVGTSTGSSNSSTTTTINLPAGVANGNITFISVAHYAATVATTIPSGWTVVYNQPGGAVVYRVFQTGDPTTGITFSDTTDSGNWWLSLAITYSGEDQTTPIDASNGCFQNSTFKSDSTPHQYLNIYYPSVNPTFNTDQFITFGISTYLSGGTISTPSGQTSQIATAVGPSLIIADKSLTGAPNTGELTSTVSADVLGVPKVGVSVVLKTASASSATPAATRPTLSFLTFTNQNTATVSPSLVGVNNGDIVAIFATAGLLGATITPPSGYTATLSTTGTNSNSYLFTHTWLTGDTVSPSFTIVGGSSWNIFVGQGIHKSGTGAGNVFLDKSGTATGAGSVSVGSLTPTTTADLALFYAGQYTLNAGTISGNAPGSMTFAIVDPPGPNNVWAWQGGVSSSLGPFTSTIAATGSPVVGGLATLWAVGSGVSATGQPQMILQ